MMLYATSHGSYTIRFHLRLDQRIDDQKLRIALDKTAQRYPYFCVSLRRNEREFYYEMNHSPVALLHTNKAITLGALETNGRCVTTRMICLLISSTGAQMERVPTR